MKHKAFAAIVNEKSKLGQKTTYQDELLSLEWQDKRLEVIERDGNICTNCNALPTTMIQGYPRRIKTKEEEKIYRAETLVEYKEFFDKLTNFNPDNMCIEMHKADKHIILHVHHKYYILISKAWQYNNDALITLCSSCHQDIHDKNLIPVYTNGFMTQKLNLTKCPRCNGSGYLGEYHYYLNGVCFGCDGYKYLELIK
jgi:5-methylcytosine-specific restriction endonuclease McrA